MAYAGDITNDPAVLKVGPTEAYKSVSLLPDEMLKYELMSQGEVPANSFMKRRQQLAALFNSGRYKELPQGVGIPFRTDIKACRAHLEKWAADTQTLDVSELMLRGYLRKLEFLDRRLQFMPVPANAQAREVYDDLVKDSQDLQGTLLATLDSLQFKESLKPQCSINVDNWSLNPESLPESPVDQPPTRFTTIKTFDSVNPLKRTDNSMLDLSLDFLSSERPSGVTFAPGKSVIQSTQKTFDPRLVHASRPCSPRPNASIKMWEWGLKFHGDPNTLPVDEFIRRAKELAKARGATLIDLFNGACDLFAGSALKWLRTGLENGIFRNWEELEAHLIIDYEGYDYCDNLLEYIKSRLQLPSERVVSYFATMEDLFLKLNRRISEEVRVKIIKRNLRADFIKGIGFMPVHSVADLKAYCQQLEADFRRIQTRSGSAVAREPLPLPRQARSAHDMNMLSNSTNTYESDYSRFEGCGNWRNDGTYLDMSYYNAHFDNSPKLSRRPVSPSANRERYQELSEEQWMRNFQELSIREEPSGHPLPVPDANYSIPPHRKNVQPENTIHSSGNYFAPQRRSDNGQFSQNSGNGIGEMNQRTTQFPQMIRRPF